MGINRTVRGYWITLLSVALLIGILGIDPAHLSGQGATATISGKVTDMSGAAVAAADVQVNRLAEGVLLTFAIREGIAVRVLVPESARRKLLAQLSFGDSPT